MAGKGKPQEPIGSGRRARGGVRWLPAALWPWLPALILNGAWASTAESGAMARPPARASLWPSNWLLVDTDLRVNGEMINTRWSSLVRQPMSAPDYSLASVARTSYWRVGGLLPVQLDTDPGHLAAADPLGYVRPQFALGGPSDSLRSWLRVAGISATGCTAPLMKMHSTFAGGNSHANVSVSARCSFH